MHGTFDEARSEEAFEYLLELRYRKEFSLSVAEYLAEPWEAILKRRLAWEFEAKRDKLEKERQALKQGRNTS